MAGGSTERSKKVCDQSGDLPLYRFSVRGGLFSTSCGRSSQAPLGTYVGRGKHLPDSHLGRWDILNW